VTTVSCAVEGDLDEAVARRLLSHVELTCGAVYGRSGKQKLRRSIAGYAQDANRANWFVLVDLDSDHPCASALVAEWLPVVPARMCLRVAVREAESWLLADRVGLASFLSVSRDRIPRDPDRIIDPKGVVTTVAKHSRTRGIREGIPPRPGSGRSIGPLYVAELSRFIREQWDVDTAIATSPSLGRCANALTTLA
jgi:hypothetical protein